VTQYTTWYHHQPRGEVTKLVVHDVPHFKPKYGRDRIVLAMEIDVDLTRVWDWNVKQIFVWVEAAYVTPDHPDGNRVVVWDHILHSPEESKIHVEKTLSKYPIEDTGSKHMKNNTVVLSVSYDVFPWVGMTGKHYALKSKVADFSHSVVLPSDYQAKLEMRQF